MIGKYKLSKCAGGKQSFARVALKLIHMPGLQEVISPVLNQPTICSLWLNASVKGARDAILSMNRDAELSVSEILEFTGTDADTNENIAWCAGFMASMDAMGEIIAVPTYDVAKEEWYIELGELGNVFMNR